MNPHDLERELALKTLAAKMRLLIDQGLEINEVCEQLKPNVLAALHMGARMSEVEDVLVRTFTNLED